MLPAGQLNRRATFQAEVPTSDEGGGYALGWRDIATVWAAYRPASVREDVAAGRLEASEAGVITVRYSSVTAVLTSASRVMIDGVPYRIAGGPTDFDQRRRFLEFKIERGVAT